MPGAHVDLQIVDDLRHQGKLLGGTDGAADPGRRVAVAWRHVQTYSSASAVKKESRVS